MQLLMNISSRLDRREDDDGRSVSSPSSVKNVAAVGDDGSAGLSKFPGADVPSNPLACAAAAAQCMPVECGQNAESICYSVAEADAAANTLRSAARVAEALAPQLPRAFRRAEQAELEVARLQAELLRLEEQIDALRRQQLRLTEGFEGEIRQRDAELAALRAFPSPSSSCQNVVTAAQCSGVTELCTTPEILTFTAEGQLGIEFDRGNTCLKVAAAVDHGMAAHGRVFPGDEILSINGVSARSLTWEEFDDALTARPSVVSLRRQESVSMKTRERPGIAGRVRAVAGWTRAAAMAVGQGLENALTDLDARDQPCHEHLGLDVLDTESSEDRNRPFYNLVRTSMAEACAQKVDGTGYSGLQDEDFERWLRSFHNERDDDWYSANHTRVYNAFRPHWDEVVTALRALSAS